MNIRNLLSVETLGCLLFAGALQLGGCSQDQRDPAPARADLGGVPRTVDLEVADFRFKTRLYDSGQVVVGPKGTTNLIAIANKGRKDAPPYHVGYGIYLPAADKLLGACQVAVGGTAAGKTTTLTDVQSCEIELGQYKYDPMQVVVVADSLNETDDSDPSNDVGVSAIFQLDTPDLGVAHLTGATTETEVLMSRSKLISLSPQLAAGLRGKP